MSFVIISVLAALSAYLGLRLSTAKSENAALRANNASLKRKLRS